MIPDKAILILFKLQNMALVHNYGKRLDNRTNVTFFFGAGAEAGVHNFDIMMGDKYNDATVLDPNNAVLSAIQKAFPTIESRLLKGESFQEELDACFHQIALFSDGKHNNEDFSKVFNYYWLCYFAIAKEVNRFFDIVGYDDPYYVLAHLNEYGKHLSGLDIGKALSTHPNSYYSLIKAWLKNNKKYKLVGVDTSNYFRFCSGIDPDVKPCYLNGRLGLFEFPRTFEIKEIKGKKMPDELFFPFLFGQSYLKPIVDDAQIRYFNRFSRSLRRSNVFIVIGYGLNNSDNHINALLAKHIRQPKKRTILVVKDKLEEQKARKIISNVKRKTKVRFVYWQNDKTAKTPKEVLNEVFEIIETSS